MASPQLEDGHLKIASELHRAIYQQGFTSLERSVIDVVMDLTYGANKGKAEMSIEDIRYMLGNLPNLRTDRLTKAVAKLIENRVLFKQQVSEGKFLLGIQKDYEKWFLEGDDKMSSLSSLYKYKANTTQSGQNVTQTTPGLFLDYLQRILDFKYSLKAWKVEYPRAKQLYREALQALRNPTDALYALKDYADYLAEDEWFRENVGFPTSYMLTRFERWLRHQPRKPLSVQSDENALGRRFRYNQKTKNWEVTQDRIEKHE